jgi:8-oxo-dGTP diphosphatase
VPEERPDAEVLAAGGLVVREGQGGVLVAVVHRPRYDDWSLPKGKLEDGEGFEAAALREVEEETGLRCELGEALEPARYRDRKGREKLVRYFWMTPIGGEFVASSEVDELRWVTRAEGLALLTHEHDRTLVSQAWTER